MLGRLGVVLDDGTANPKVVTRRVSGLEFTKTAMGGDHSARLTLRGPLADFPGLGPADRIHIDDTVTGRRLFTGYTENPGRSTSDGEQFQLGAQGGAVRARDESRPLVYVDRELSKWVRDGGVAPSAQTSTGAHPQGSAILGDGVIVQFPPGQPVDTNWLAGMAYRSFGDMKAGAIAITYTSGKTDGGYVHALPYRQESGTESYVLIGSPETMDTTTRAEVYGTGTGWNGTIPSDLVGIGLRIGRLGGPTNVADDLTWTFFADISIIGGRLNRAGVLQTGLTGLRTAENVTAAEVVEDLYGRLLRGFCDSNTVVIETGVAEALIDQLTYHDGANAGQVLDDLALWEPDMLWQIGPQLPNGKHTFVYRAWPTEHRYEIGPQDDYVAPGGEQDLCNRVVVYWNDSTGAKQSTTVTAAVPELDDLLRIKDAKPITLPDGKGSAANAQAIGEQVLAAMARPASAGKATIRRPIFDHLWQRWVMPWELEPGYLAMVRRTGEVLRVTQMEYSDPRCAADLTLGEPMLTMEQRVARLGAQRSDAG